MVFQRKESYVYVSITMDVKNEYFLNYEKSQALQCAMKAF